MHKENNAGFLQVHKNNVLDWIPKLAMYDFLVPVQIAQMWCKIIIFSLGRYVFMLVPDIKDIERWMNAILCYSFLLFSYVNHFENIARFQQREGSSPKHRL